MTLYFPHMHPALLSDSERQALPGDVRFLDPGLAAPDSPDHLLPEAAPFDRRLAKAILADTMRFGESVTNPRDIAAHGLLQQAQALAPESGRLVLGEVERSVAGAEGKAEAPDLQLEARRQAQTLLLLAWNLEGHMLDLRQIDLGLRDSFARLGESVIPAEEAFQSAAAGSRAVPSPSEANEDIETDGDTLSMGKMLSGLSVPEAFGEAMPWRRILEAFVVLAPGLALVTADEAIVQALREAGVPESKGAFEAPAWRLSGLDRCPAARPWLDVPVRLEFLAVAGQGA
jgi:hypothetical protein